MQSHNNEQWIRHIVDVIFQPLVDSDDPAVYGPEFCKAVGMNLPQEVYSRVPNIKPWKHIRPSLVAADLSDGEIEQLRKYCLEVLHMGLQNIQFPQGIKGMAYQMDETMPVGLRVFYNLQNGNMITTFLSGNMIDTLKHNFHHRLVAMMQQGHFRPGLDGGGAPDMDPGLG